MKYKLTFITILLVIISFFSGCVYYNTFHNARKAFNEAEKSRKGSMYKGGRINQAKYKIAIEKSLKVIENYPNSKWYDDALYVLAVSYFYTQKYSKAGRRFREILTNYADSKYAKESEVYLAKTKLELNDEQAAMELFENIFKSDFDKSFKAEAAMALGNYHYQNKNLPQAQQFYLAVRDSLGSNEEKKIAQKFVADGYYNMFRFQESIGAYLQLLGMNLIKSEKYHAYKQLANCSFKLMRISEGMDYLQTLIDDEAYFDSLGVLKLLLAEGYEYDEDIAQAEAIYREISEQEKNKKVAAEAYYNLGLIYQFDYDDLKEAKAFYDNTVELNRSSDFGKDALQRSSDIGKLETFARTIKIDSTTTQDLIDNAAFTQYQLAELYWFNLNKPDTAIMEMQYLIDSFPTSFEVPKAMIALSQMYREFKKDTAAADSILRTILVEYPHTDFVPEVLEILNLAGTEADTGYAELYINQAETFLVDEENIDSARVYYQYIVDNFPDSKYYLQARFSLIWLTEMYESPGDSSVIYAYNEFVDSFPSSSWSQEARKRISYTPPKKYVEEVTDTSGSDEERVEDEFPGRYSDTLEDTSTYIDPLEGIYIDPDGNKAINLPEGLQPIETREEFIYPTEAYRLAWEGDLYFQIFLDFSGEVVEVVQKTRSGSEELDREVLKTVQSMIFDNLRIPTEIQNTWFVYKYKVRLPDHLR